MVSPRGVWVALGVALGLAALALVLGPTPLRPSGPTSSLPDGAESTRVARLQATFAQSDVAPAVVVFDRHGAALTAADRAAIAGRASALAAVGLPGASPVIDSSGGTAAIVAVPLRLGAADEKAKVTALRTLAKQDLPSGLRAQVTGAPAYDVDLAAVFNGANTTLLLTTVGVVALLLLLTYRSPVLWLVPLSVVGLADQVSVRLLGLATHAFAFRVDDAVAGITSVLVFGAGTNYALLLIARYREELGRQQDRRRAMAVALHRAGPAILASSSTVVLALLTLSLAHDPFNRALGYAGAIGIATAVVSALTLLPVVLVLCGRGLFWPFVPRAGKGHAAADGFWGRIASGVARHTGVVLALSVALIGGLALLLTSGVRAGLSQDQQFRATPEAVTGQRALAAAFPAGTAEPSVVLAPPSAAADVVARASQVPGVVSARPGKGSATWQQIDVVLSDPRGSKAASATIERLRTELPGPAIVGGPEAEDLDAHAAAAHDQRVVLPAILLVVLAVLLLLLRSVVASLVLVLTVVATYAAALGAGWWISHDLLGFPAFDLGVPLLTFLFLVALGVDYNIFLSTRAREEARRMPTAGAVTAALAVTGGVITSAGILLAAVFAVLGVLPVVTLTQVGIVVGLGVLLDTLVVRTLVVPALVTVLGERFWWPGHPAADRTPALMP